MFKSKILEHEDVDYSKLTELKFRHIPKYWST